MEFRTLLWFFDVTYSYEIGKRNTPNPTLWLPADAKLCKGIQCSPRSTFHRNTSIYMP